MIVVEGVEEGNGEACVVRGDVAEEEGGNERYPPPIFDMAPSWVAEGFK